MGPRGWPFDQFFDPKQKSFRSGNEPEPMFLEQHLNSSPFRDIEKHL
jgi:hypothetical protein